MSGRLRHSPARAIFFIATGTGFMAGADICMKYMAASHSLLSIQLIRNFMILGALFIILKRTGEWANAVTRPTPLQIARGVTMGTAPLLFYYALMFMPVAETTAIFLLIPVIVALLAVPVLKERPNPRRIVAAILGFAGTLIIVRPGTEAFTPVGLVALGAAIFAASYQLLTRKLAGKQSALASLFYPWTIGTVLCLPFAFMKWTPPVSGFEWFMVALTATLSLMGNFFLVRAYEHGHAGLIAPFVYLQLVWAIVLAFIFLGDFPDGWSLAGMSIIVMAGLILFRPSGIAPRD
jgi:drug/metabolite transporter (DMT)-like permease